MRGTNATPKPNDPNHILIARKTPRRMMLAKRVEGGELWIEMPILLFLATSEPSYRTQIAQSISKMGVFALE
jgi:hypothetical protein